MTRFYPEDLAELVRNAPDVAEEPAATEPASTCAFRLKADRDEARRHAEDAHLRVLRYHDATERLHAAVREEMSALRTENARLREALETIGTSCTAYWGGKTDCVRDGRTRNAEYLADRWCDACIAREALTAPAADEGSAP